MSESAAGRLLRFEARTTLVAALNGTRRRLASFTSSVYSLALAVNRFQFHSETRPRGVNQTSIPDQRNGEYWPHCSASARFHPGSHLRDTLVPLKCPSPAAFCATGRKPTAQSSQSNLIGSPDVAKFERTLLRAQAGRSINASKALPIP